MTDEQCRAILSEIGSLRAEIRFVREEIAGLKEWQTGHSELHREEAAEDRRRANHLAETSAKQSVCAAAELGEVKSAIVASRARADAALLLSGTVSFAMIGLLVKILLGV